MRLDGYSIGELGWEDAGTRTYHATDRQSSAPVLVRVPRAAQPTREQLAALRRDYEVARSLDDAAVVRPLALAPLGEGEGLALVLEDGGMRPLAQALTLPLADPGRFLEIALELTQALAGVHRAQVIHKNLQPHSIWLDPASGRVALTDFSLAAHTTAEGQPLYGGERIEGRLEYIAPEQTGRMNRAVDHRTDHYALGVVLYQLLTGRLPFASWDPLELIHAHLARQPPPPHELDPRIPEALSAIVMKLLAKMAEDRYQSAEGLRLDLAGCLEEWRARGAIPALVPGQRDSFEAFRVSQKLYGREAERVALLEAFDRAAEGATELLLVTGAPGIGKSMLVNEVQKPITRSRGYFLAGKFDQYRRNVPYSAIIQALRELVAQLLRESDAEIAGWRERLGRALGESGQVIVEVIPEIELITGPQPPVPALPPAEARNRFTRLFRDFLRVCARAEHPLALFLDDLQWADAASLALLEVLATDRDTRHLLVIGAYRDSEVSAAHPLMLALREIAGAGVPIRTLTLAPLGPAQVTELVADTLRAEPEAVRPLAALVHRKTDGNPFFVVQFLNFLHRERLVEFDALAARWRWELERIDEQGITDDVVELMTVKLRRLPGETQEALRVAACIGGAFDLATLATVIERPPAGTLARVRPAVTEGLVLTPADVLHLGNGEGKHTGNGAGGPNGNGAGAPAENVRLRFLHDRVQQAAYALIPEAERRQVHLTIGRLLRASISEAELEESPFDVVQHYERGAGLIEEQEEKEELARLCLVAGRRARESSAFADAVRFFRGGMELLGEDAWQRLYDLTFELHYGRFECEYLTGDFAEADRLFGLLLENARTRVEKARVFYTKVLVSTSLDRTEEAVQVGIEGLKLFGVKLPAKPNPLHLLGELAKVKLAAGRREPEALLALPEMTDPEKQAIMSLLMSIGPAAYFKNPEVTLLAALKIVNLSLRHGNASFSSFGYVLLGMLLGAGFGRYASGHAYGRLAVELVRRFDAPGPRCKALLIFGGFVDFWRRPYDSSKPVLADAFRSALEAGDVQYGNYAVLRGLSNLGARGAPLAEILGDCARFESHVRQSKDPFAIHAVDFWRQSARALRGETRGGSELSDEGYDEAAAVESLRAGENLTTLGYYYVHKVQLLYLFEEYRAAGETALLSHAQVQALLSQSEEAEHYIYAGLTAAALCREVPAERARWWKLLGKCRKKLALWARNCPENFAHPLRLLEAEIASLSERSEEAARLFDEAVASAQEQEFLQLQALGNELAARHYLRRGQRKVAATYLQEARAAYEQWGATAKVRQLEERHGELLPPRPPPPAAPEPLAASGSAPSGAGLLDLDAVMRASQALSSEVQLERLLERLMRLVVQYAGAQRGCLVLPAQESLRVEAEITGESDPVRVLESVPIDEHPRLLAPLVHYVARTRGEVVLHDAPGDPRYDGYPYVLRERPRSILCTPLVQQGELVGVLYLENNLASGAFTPERLQMLHILTADVAIAIENARLTGTVRSQREDLQAALSRVDLLEQAKGHLTKFVPQSVQRMIEENPAELDLVKRQREVSILFLDIAGYARITELLDQEQVNFLIERYFSSFLDDIHANSGEINETAGDGLMIIFQDPQEHAAQALRTALAIRGKTEEINRELAGRFEPVMVRIGVNSGVASVGFTRFESASGTRYTYTASGSVTNVAARIAAAATLETPLLLSEETARRTEGRFRLSDLGPRHFKNVGAPVRVFALEAEQ